MKGLTSTNENSKDQLQQLLNSSTTTSTTSKSPDADSEKDLTKIIITINPCNGDDDDNKNRGTQVGLIVRPKTLSTRTQQQQQIIQPEDSEDEHESIPGLSPEGGEMHCKIINAFTHAFAKQNIHIERAIQTLDALNDQIIAFIFSPDSEPLHLQLNDHRSGSSSNNVAKYKQNGTTTEGNQGKYQQEAVKAAIALMRRLLLDAQGKFRKMVEENKALGGRLDGDLQSAHHQMTLLRAELSDTNKRLSLIGSAISNTTNTPPSSAVSTPSHSDFNMAATNSPMMTTTTAATMNGLHANYTDGGKSSSPGPPGGQLLLNGIYAGNNSNSSNNGSLRSHHLELDFEEPSTTNNFLDLDSLPPNELRKECERLVGLVQNLQCQIKEVRRNSRNGNESRASSINSNSGTTNAAGGAGNVETELQHAKEALSALKADRKRLKAEKFELLNQMKQLYVTLEDKEKELRDFIRNYEQRMRESESSLQRLAVERDEAERERWSILRHARDEAERGLALATQLNLREAQVQQLQEELHEARRQLSQYGIYAEPDSRSNCTNTNSHYSLVSSLTATYATMGGDRGSSADSGVRLSSDRDSGGGLQATGNLSDSANEAISLDLCGDGGSGDGDSLSVISTATLPQLFASSRDSPGLITFSSLTRSLQDANALSKSAEQLLAAEAVEARRKSGRRSGAEFSNSSRNSTGAKGAWGSISRVFARNKHRRTLDPSIYDGLKSGQRSSWSPQGSVPPSPLAEQESYSDKLRALEEAATLPMELWRAGMVQAWVEISLGMPQYGSRCGDNIKSGKVLLELSDVDLETELGITHPLHRKKLRLAIEEHRNPALVRFPCIVELSHVWVSSEWLPDIGLPQYVEHFAGCLVDARLLDHLSKKDLEKYLGVTRKFHLASIAHGVHLLRMVAYDRQNLAERRRQCESDPLVWTNQRFVQWARSIDLHEYSENLKGSGVHGAFAVLEPTFNGDTLASAMGIPPNKQIIRRHLGAELDALLNPARAKITQQYRVTKSRLSTLEKQRSDSLGRNASLNNAGASGNSNDSFRRTTAEENRRRTSLRSSLSRALGLKLKQDLAQQRRDQQEDAQKTAATRPTEFSTFIGNNGSGSAAGFNSQFLLPSPSSSQYSEKYYTDYRNGSQTMLNGDSATSSPFHNYMNSNSQPQSSQQFAHHSSTSTFTSRPQSLASLPSTSNTSTVTMKHEDNESNKHGHHQKILETEIVDDEEDNKSNNHSISNSVSAESIHKIQQSVLVHNSDNKSIEESPSPATTPSNSQHQQLNNHMSVHTPV